MKRMSLAAVAFAGVLVSALPVSASAAPVLPLVRGGESRTGMFRADNGGVAEKFADASVTWTEDALEVRIRRRLEPGETAGAIGTQENPAGIFGGGGVTVEMLVSPHPAEPDVFYQFAVNPSNVLYQARLFDTKWRPARPVTSRVFFGKDEWGATIRIPFGAFGEAPVADGTNWKADFGCGRFDWAGVPTRHDPSAYGTLRFGTAPQRAYVENVTRGDDGFVHVTYAVRPGTGDAEIPHKALADSSLSLTANGTPVADVHFAASGADPDYLSLDRYYYRPGEDIVYSAKGFGKGSTVTVRRLADGQVVQTVASDGAGTLSGVRFAPGEYAFEIADAVQHTACQFEVADEVGASSLTNGTAFGISSADPKVLVADFGERKGLPFYPILGSALFRGSLGIRGALSLKYVTKPQAGYLADPETVLPSALAALGKGQGRGVTLNRLAYEAQIKVLVPDADGQVRPVSSQGEFFMNAYRTLKEKFPDRIISLQTDSPSAVAELAPACDVLEFAGGGSYGANPLLCIRSALDLARKAAGEKPIVFWLGGALPEKGSRRSADEANTAVRYCILRGVSGTVFHMGHGGVPESRTRLWSFLRGAERAVNAWYPAWAAGTPAEVAADCEAGVEVGARKTSAGWILIAVNLDPHRRSFAFTDPSTGVRRTVRLTGFGSVVLAAANGPKPVRVALTFDDGTKDHVALAAPMLEERGWRGTFNIVTDKIGTKGHLTWGDVKELIRRGHEIVTHTKTHPSLVSVLKQKGPDAVRREWAASRDAIIRNAGFAPRYACMPFMQENAEIRAICREEGLEPFGCVRHNFGTGDEEKVGPWLEQCYADGVVRVDALCHGVTSGEGGGWRPFADRAAFAKYLDQIVALEKAGKVIVTDYAGVMSGCALKAKAWPRHGVLTLSFDDHHIRRWDATLPLFAKYGATATFCISGGIDGDVVAFARKALAGGHEIALHGLCHRNADAALPQMGEAEYWAKELEPQLADCRQAGIPVSSFAYPNCRHSEESDRLFLAHGFTRLRGSIPGVKSPNPHDPKGLKLNEWKPVATYDPMFASAEKSLADPQVPNVIMGRCYHTDIADILAAMDRAGTRAERLSIVSHDIAAEPTGIGMRTEWLERMLSFADAAGVVVRGLK